jgi:hypothetical protein
MKTKEVIRLLQECDPSGEEEVLVGNHSLFDIMMEPAYYDGSAQILIRDETNPYYNVIGARWTNEGNKVVITAFGIEEALLNNPDLPVEIETNNPRHIQLVKEWREETREIIARVEEGIKAREKKKNET